jgi:hypothetical protein
MNMCCEEMLEPFPWHSNREHKGKLFTALEVLKVLGRMEALQIDGKQPFWALSAPFSQKVFNLDY